MNHNQGVHITTNRRIWVFNLCAAMALMLAFSSDAVAGTTRTVRVGVYQNEPKIFMDDKGQVSGIFADLLVEIAAQEGWELVYVSCEWADCLQALEDGQIDLMPDVAYSPERDAKYDFHKTPVLESWSGVYVNPGAPINNISHLDGKRVAVLSGSIQQTAFEQMMNGFGFEATIIPVESLEQAFTLTANGSTDAAIANHFFGDYFYQEYGLAKTTIIFNPSTLYYAAAEGRNHDLLDAIDRHLGKWIQEPKSKYYMTLSRWGEREPPQRVPQYIFWIIGGITGLLAAAIGMVFLLRRQVAMRARKLEQINAELRVSEQRYQTLARISPVGIFQTDANGATTYVNPKWSAISGLSTDQALGDGWLEAVHPDDKEKLKEGWQKSAQLHQASFSDYRFLRPDGTIAWVMGQAVPEMNSENQIIGYVGTITDITERKRAEEEIYKLNVVLEQRIEERTRELKEAQEQLVQKERLAVLGRLASGVAHELRNPLAVINNALYYLKLVGTNGNEKMREYLGIIETESHTANKIIVDLLDFANVKFVDREPVSVYELIRLALDHLPAPPSVQVAFEIPQGLPSVYVDSHQMSQALGNLIINAYQAMSLAGMTSTGGKLTFTAREEQGMIAIAVKDNGVGIPPENMGKIFEPLFTTKARGIGLGLAVSQKLAEANGGRIEVQSEVGKGSTFTVFLPIKVEAHSL